MTFTPLNPTAPIQTIVSMAFGANPDGDPATWTWTDVSAYVRGQVTITKGRADFAQTADATRMNFTLNNTDGRFTPGNPLSPYWPNVVRNVPVRVQLTGFGDPLAAPYERATCFVDQWPLTPNAGTIDVISQISASGKLRRLQKGNKPVRSPLFRAIPTLAPLAYWPMEDGSTATQCASAVAGVAPMTIRSGTATFGATPPAGAGTAAAVDFSAGLSMQGNVPAAAASTSWRVTMAMSWGNGTIAGGTTQAPLSIVTASGDIWYITVIAGSPIFTVGIFLQTVSGVGGGGTTIGASAWTVAAARDLHLIDLIAVQNGSNVDVSATLGSHAWATVAGFFTGITLAKITSVRPGDANGTPTIQTFQLSHVAVTAPASTAMSTTAPDLTNAVKAYAGETADTRVTRVCSEQGVRATVTTGTYGSVQAMGPQPITSFPDILHDTETTDLGFLHDGGTLGNLVYLSNSTRYNATVAAALDHRLGHLGDSFAGTFDDQRLINDSAASRSGGSSVEYASATSVAAEGEYDEGLTFNVYADAQLGPLAQARVGVGTYGDMRYPLVDLDLIRSPGLAQQALTIVPGSRITIAGLPTPPYPPGLVDQFVEQITEVLAARTWRMALTCSPAQPYRAAVIQDAANPWVVDAGNSTLNGAHNATTTSWSIATSTGPLWSTAGGDYPRLAYCDGEEIQITAMAGGSSPQTATVVRSINGIVKAHSSGASVSLYRPAVIAL